MNLKLFFNLFSSSLLFIWNLSWNISIFSISKNLQFYYWNIKHVKVYVQLKEQSQVPVYPSNQVKKKNRGRALVSPKGSTLMILSLLTPPVPTDSASLLQFHCCHQITITSCKNQSWTTSFIQNYEISSKLDLTDIKVEALPSRSLKLRGLTDRKCTSEIRCREHTTEVAQAEIFGSSPHLLSFQLSCTPFLLHYPPGLGLEIISFFVAYCSVVHSLSHVWLFATAWTEACQCPSLSPGVCSNSCPLT